MNLSKYNAKKYLLPLILLMLFSFAMNSQSISQEKEYPAIEINDSFDTLFVFNQDQSIYIFKILEEKDLLVREILNFYEIENELQKKQSRLDSVTLINKTIQQVNREKIDSLQIRLNECEALIQVGNDEIKKLNRKLKWNKTFNRTRTIFEVVWTVLIVWLLL